MKAAGDVCVCVCARVCVRVSVSVCNGTLTVLLLQCVAVCCSVLQCVAMCCSVFSVYNGTLTILFP